MDIVLLDCVFMLFQEVAEPLQDLKEGMDQLEKNRTLRYILTTLLAIGNFLNGTNVSNPQTIYGFKVPSFFTLTLSLCVFHPLPPFPPTLLLPPPLTPPQTYLFGRDNSGLCV